MQATLMQQGIELMLYGMGTVFVFLAVLVVATMVMSSMLQRYVKPVAPTVATIANKAEAVEDKRLLAIISAAVHKYRARHKK